MDLDLTALDYALLAALFLVAWLYLSGSGKKSAATTTSAAPGKKAAATGTTSSTRGTSQTATARHQESESGYPLVDRLGARKVLVCYGSQTGTAEEYAGRMAKEAAQYGLKAMVADLMDHDPDDLRHLPADKLLVLALATYGEGEPTDNARDFHEWLMSEDRWADKELFAKLHYVIFGLGNKTYEHYNTVARTVDRRLQELGATRVGARGEGDDDGNLEEDFLAWKEDMWKAVCGHYGIDPATVKLELIRSYALKELAPTHLAANPRLKVFTGEHGTVGAWDGKQNRLSYDQKHPYYATIASWRELFTPGLRDDPTDPSSLQRSCLHVEIDLGQSNIRYMAGDHLAVYPSNDPEEVEALARALGLSERLDQPFEMRAVESSSKKHPFPCPTTYRAALAHYLDIQSLPRTHILSALAQYARDPAERIRLERMSVTAHKEEYMEYVVHAGRNLRQVLQDHPSVKIMPDSEQVVEEFPEKEGMATATGEGHCRYLTVGDVLELMPHLQPRYYSISSSSRVHPGRVHITVAVARYRTKLGREGTGVATGYLHRLCHSEAYRAREGFIGVSDNSGVAAAFRVPVFVRASTFRLPKNLTKPIVMIGPGTGVAPFRSFIQERTAITRERIKTLRTSGRFSVPSEVRVRVEEVSLPGGLHLKRVDLLANGIGTVVGESLLLYGCRNREHDFLYGNEWRTSYFNEAIESEDNAGTGLTELVCAFSREQPGAKTYVQHRLRERGRQVWQMLSEGEGHLYVCGDAKNMARDVQRALIELAMAEGRLGEDEAHAFVKRLRDSHRYLEDVWS